ncbi:hypothetical protein BBI17_005480 [Phytophthora kernoviae]|uniref:ribonuclease H n=1 Tax=Phytophthora kernoviae TaxID=325452 RepID=A0A3R7MS64_9STRA|nr:hypothetical protein JM16_007379 [Phytophthora kernoviae]KAG2520055.1 hypothetical protein JM18_007304 [Phytophthora kernoviae]RLN27420.1 hypothetical protein BBI17_005480 [Phytophthora kernoviae]
MAKSGFYAVAAGRSPGIFTSWSEAEAQIRGFSGARGHKTGVFQTWNEAKQQVEGMRSAKFKKFPTQEEAQAFVDQHAAATQTQPSDPDPKDPNTLVAFCDGSALQNGQRGCQAGYACIFPHHTEWNVATKLVEDRATNNRAEYLAGLEALKRANIENPDGNRVLYIFSDSMLLIRSMTEWVGTWQKNGWKKSDGAAVMNRDLLELLAKSLVLVLVVLVEVVVLEALVLVAVPVALVAVVALVALVQELVAVVLAAVVAAVALVLALLVVLALVLVALVEVVVLAVLDLVVVVVALVVLEVVVALALVLVLVALVVQAVEVVLAFPWVLVCDSQALGAGLTDTDASVISKENKLNVMTSEAGILEEKY